MKSGNLLASSAHALVNTVNCVGVMGKGIALAFKRKYPEMFDDYVRRCDRGEVRLGEPYVYDAGNRLILNFPTKDHWRAVSRLEDIVAGLEHLTKHYRAWGIRSLAVPPLGCGNGQLTRTNPIAPSASCWPAPPETRLACRTSSGRAVSTASRGGAKNCPHLNCRAGSDYVGSRIRTGTAAPPVVSAASCRTPGARR